MHADLMGDAKKEGHCPAPKDLMGERVHETRVTIVCLVTIRAGALHLKNQQIWQKILCINKEKQCFNLGYEGENIIDMMNYIV